MCCCERVPRIKSCERLMRRCLGTAAAKRTRIVLGRPEAGRFASAFGRGRRPTLCGHGGSRRRISRALSIASRAVANQVRSESTSRARISSWSWVPCDGGGGPDLAARRIGRLKAYAALRTVAHTNSRVYEQLRVPWAGTASHSSSGGKGRGGIAAERAGPPAPHSRRMQGANRAGRLADLLTIFCPFDHFVLLTILSV